MAEVPTSTGAPALRSTHAVEWGLGSILLGLLLLVAVPLGAAAAVLGLTLYANGTGVWTERIERAIFDVILAVNVVLFAVPAFGLWCGLRGLRWARSTGTAGGLPATGVFLNTVILLVLVLALIVIAVTRSETLSKYQDENPKSKMRR